MFATLCVEFIVMNLLLKVMSMYKKIVLAFFILVNCIVMNSVIAMDADDVDYLERLFGTFDVGGDKGGIGNGYVQGPVAPIVDASSMMLVQKIGAPKKFKQVTFVEPLKLSGQLFNEYFCKDALLREMQEKIDAGYYLQGNDLQKIFEKICLIYLNALTISLKEGLLSDLSEGSGLEEELSRNCVLRYKGHLDRFINDAHSQALSQDSPFVYMCAEVFHFLKKMHENLYKFDDAQELAAFNSSIDRETFNLESIKKYLQECVPGIARQMLEKTENIVCSMHPNFYSSVLSHFKAAFSSDITYSPLHDVPERYKQDKDFMNAVYQLNCQFYEQLFNAMVKKFFNSGRAAIVKAGQLKNIEPYVQQLAKLSIKRELDRYVAERGLYLNDIARQDAMNCLNSVSAISWILLGSFVLCKLMQNCLQSETHCVPNIIVIGMMSYLVVCELQTIRTLLQA